MGEATDSKQMRKQQEMVREFHEKCGAIINHAPTEIDRETQQLRYKLIAEELEELVFAFGEPQIKPYDTKEVADALGDLLYVILGAAVSCGIDMESVFAEIHRSNMTKFIDGYKREDGKWIKGPSYSPANISEVLAKQFQP